MKTSSLQSQKSSQKLISFLAVLLLGALFFNVWTMMSFTRTVNEKLDEAIKLAAPQKITLTMITPEDCEQCRNLEALKQNITAQNVELTTENSFSSSAPEALQYIQKYDIKTLPALIFESEENMKPSLKNALAQGAQEVDAKTLVWEQNFPPYYSVVDTKAIGLVEAIFITDSSCTECYDVVTVQKSILSKFGAYIANEKIVDIATPEGGKLASEYGITKLPTILLSSDASAYDALQQVWAQVGTIESDGTFVFRNMEVLSVPFRDLETGAVIPSSLSKSS